MSIRNVRDDVVPGRRGGEIEQIQVDVAGHAVHEVSDRDGDRDRGGELAYAR